MRFLAVLFDLDGTLLNTLCDLGESMNAVLRAHGFPGHPLDSYRVFVGDGVDILVMRALPEPRRGDRALIGALAGEMRAEYGRRWKDSTRPYSGVPELLQGLDALGLKRAVLTNKPHEMAVIMLKHFFPGPDFCAVMGQRPGFPKKPDPAAALEICRVTGIPPSGFMYIGDSNVDMRTAVAAGMFPVGALWGFRGEGELREAGARCLVAHPLELLSLIEADFRE